MQKPKRQFKLGISRVIILCLICVALTAGTIYAVTPTSTFYISSGVYPAAPSYTIWTETANYFAKDAYGMVAFSGTSAPTVIQSAINSLPGAGGIIYLKVGVYPLTTGLILKTHVSLIGEQKNAVTLYMVDGADSDAIFIDNAHNCVIQSLRIDGNDAGNAGGDGIKIESDVSMDTYHLIRDVMIENVATNAIYIAEFPRAVTIDNVMIARPSEKGISIDSTDNEVMNTLIGWAGTEGLLVSGDSNRITNVEIWDCGEKTEPSSERSGVVISGARNLISMVDSDRNKKHGFVIMGSFNTLSGCIARNNGLSGIESYGFDFYNAQYNILTGCIATDEQTPKTQDYGLVEGGSSDYNIITSCSFIGNAANGIKSIAGANTKVRLVYNGTSWVA